MAITAAQCRAARALIGWSQKDLAEHASVGTSTVADFERGARKLTSVNMATISTILENAGIKFLAGGCRDQHFKKR